MINTNNDHSVVCSDAVANDSKNQQNSYHLLTTHPKHKNECPGLY